jgi:hypothetical protein
VSQLKPGWVDSIQHIKGDTNDDQRLRAEGRRPFRHNGWGTRCESSMRGAYKAVGRGRGGHPVDRALGPVEAEDES